MLVIIIISSRFGSRPERGLGSLWFRVCSAVTRHKPDGPRQSQQVAVPTSVGSRGMAAQEAGHGGEAQSRDCPSGCSGGSFSKRSTLPGLPQHPCAPPAAHGKGDVEREKALHRVGVLGMLEDELDNCARVPRLLEGTRAPQHRPRGSRPGRHVA